jgi:hypothetical protein
MRQSQTNADQSAQEIARLADEFARKATRDILKPDYGLSVFAALEKKSMPDATSRTPRPRYPFEPSVVDAIRETRRLVDDLNLRIIRQRKRVEKIIIERFGPREEMEALLADMIKARDQLLAQVDSFE